MRLRRWSFPIVSALLAVPASGQTWPLDFVTENIARDWDRPTCICFTDHDDNSSLLVTEKAGLLTEVRDGVKGFSPVIDLRLEVLDSGDRGLLSVQVDPDFETNGWIYLLYIVDPNSDGSDSEQESFGRLTRYTTYRNANGELLADPTSRLVLIGATWPEGIPSLHLSHSVGNLRFGVDGSLFLSTGDGAHYDLTDTGGYDPNGFGPGKFAASEDIGAYRSLSLTSLAGKILRVDPATGLGLPDNPYYTGNPNDHASRVFALGLRNPFRFTVRPDTGTPGKLYVADVGWNSVEEINSAVGGENFGWPCWEGPNVQSSYDAADPIGACDDPTIFDKPLWAFHHYNPGPYGITAQCVTGLQVYGGTEYPSQYQGRLFFSEYASDWIRTVRFVNGLPTEIELFGSNIGNPVDLIADPVNGDLIYIAIGDNAIRRIRYTKTNHPPVVVASATPRWGAAPLATTFDASGSTDPEGQPLTYLWDFGDGTTDTNATVVHTYTANLNYTATLTVTDVGGESESWSTLISVGNTPPAITVINSPLRNSFYSAGQLLTFDGAATDAEDDAASTPLVAEWRVDLVHDHHEHPAWAKLPGFTAQWTADSHGAGTYFHVALKVTDSRGLTDFKSVDIFDVDATPHPHLVEVSDTSPRLGTPVRATAHLHYAGKGDAGLLFDWGDGSVSRFRAAHMEDRGPKHTYLGPGVYTLRVIGTDGAASELETQTILVRPLQPGVAIFTPIVAAHFINANRQWQIASALAESLRAAGYEAEIFGHGRQTELKQWLSNYLNDGIRDYLVVLDVAPSIVYSGQDDGSLAETWLDDGNGVLWTGYNPFARYVRPDGTDDNAGAGTWAADEVLDAAIPHLCGATATMLLGPDAADLPTLTSFATTRALTTARLNTGWTIPALYSTDGLSPPSSDGIVIRNANGGEYAQFYCVNDNTTPRATVMRDFFLTHLYAGLPTGPGGFQLVAPPDGATDLAAGSELFHWQAKGGATSWLFELALDAEFTHPVHTEVVTQPQLTLSGVLDGQRTYHWRVTARTDFGSWASGEFDFTTRGPASR